MFLSSMFKFDLFHCSNLVPLSGNELSGSGVAARVDAKQYAQDLITLRSFLNDLYQNSSTLPLVIAPGGFFNQQWYSQLLENSGPGVLDVLTHHIYNLGAGMNQIRRFYLVYVTNQSKSNKK